MTPGPRRLKARLGDRILRAKLRDENIWKTATTWEDEIRLMKQLTRGPCALDFGPVGRCSSRGWIRYLALDERMRGIFELTPLGRARLEEHAGEQVSDDDEGSACGGLG